MQPRGGRVWAWVFPIACVMGLVGLSSGVSKPVLLAFDIGCIATGLIGSALLFEFKASEQTSGLKCANCGKPAPKFHKPANRRQMLWGGWTCKKCGAELDGRGRVVEE